jgi:hypothetical protein
MTNGSLTNTNLLNMEITGASIDCSKHTVTFILKSSASRSAAGATTAATSAFCRWVVTSENQI